ncbi:hypothetical protein TNCV_3117401 [Trichonephila clavipes]|uniref:Uncharacterized protein n=1 Tax=Trichonephila clavipes TaxID=2585209 RepID=A0A8X6W8Z3_TRICX|nr:hypothetical protein TNCV_3117401 [Trichonephila clavipes]
MYNLLSQAIVSQTRFPLCHTMVGSTYAAGMHLSSRRRLPVYDYHHWTYRSVTYLRTHFSSIRVSKETYEGLPQLVGGCAYVALAAPIRLKLAPFRCSSHLCYTARELLTTDHVILSHGQVTWTTPELAPLSLNYHTTPTGGRFSSRQI